jgi:hypothetical protein
MRNKPSSFKSSPEDEATYAIWRRRVFIFYLCIGLTGLGVVLATHFSRLGFQLAGS